MKRKPKLLNILGTPLSNLERRKTEKLINFSEHALTQKLLPIFHYV